MQFFAYLLEKYAEYKGESTTNVLKTFDEAHLTDYIKQMYPMYHSERLKNAFADIDKTLGSAKNKETNKRVVRSHRTTEPVTNCHRLKRKVPNGTTTNLNN